MNPISPLPCCGYRVCIRFLVQLVAVFVSAAAPLASFAAPRAPTEAELRRLAAERQSHAFPLATATPLTVDTSSREAVRQFYQAVYSAADAVPIEWTGNHSPGGWGTTSPAFKEAVILRINALRAFAGVPAGVTLNPTYSDKAQQAALIMSLNGQLSHYPPNTWSGYTAEGYEAAGKSNLSLGLFGPAAITGYVLDHGANNAAAGHRRWILYPQTTEMGTGDVPEGNGKSAANATWVVTSQAGSPRPATRTSYVAWPPRGYTPAPLIFPRWSFSYPDAGFSGATVSMTRDGAPVPVRLESVANGAGENALVWVYDNLDANLDTTPTVTSDSTFRVTVNNVLIGGAPQSFTYDVIAFDPDRTGPDTVPVSVTGSSTPTAGLASTYTVTRPAFADAFQWRVLSLDSTVPTYGAETGLDGIIAATTGGYSARVGSPAGAGAGAYHLAMPDFENQYLSVPETFFAPTSGSSQLTFLSRLGWASDDQVARVQVSIDDGTSWSDLYAQPGANGAGETSYTNRSVALSALAGLTFRLRFAYTFVSGSAFMQTEPNVGWLIDGITLTGVQRVAGASTPPTGGGSTFAFSRSAAGAAGLQARGVLFSRYPMAWGPVYPVTVSAGLTFSTQPADQAGPTGSSVSLSAAAATVPANAYQWLRNGAPIAGATGSTLALANFQPADTGLYRAVGQAASSSGLSRAAIVSVASTSKVVGAGQELQPVDIRHPNGNIFDQVLATGAAEAITAEYTLDQITRTSFIDLDGDIVQVEFGGPGTLSLVLDGATAPATPVNYYQPTVQYVKGHAGIVITDADERTNVSVFTVGRATAFDPTGAYNILLSPNSTTNNPANNGSSLFVGHGSTTYDGIADIAFIAIASRNGKFGGVRTSNANYFATKGYTGIYAPGVEFAGPVYVGNITAFETATPVLVLGSALGNTWITGGDLFQENGEPVQVSGLTQLRFQDGSDSHGRLIEARSNRAVLQRDGQNVTAQVVVNP